MAENTRDELLELLKQCNPRTRKTVMRVNKTDLLLDGPYWQKLPTNWRWRGSDNQRFIALSDRYSEQVSGWNAPTGQQFEIHMGENGRLEVFGIPPIELAIAQARHPSINSNYCKV